MLHQLPTKGYGCMPRLSCVTLISVETRYKVPSGGAWQSQRFQIQFLDRCSWKQNAIPASHKLLTRDHVEDSPRLGMPNMPLGSGAPERAPGVWAAMATVD